MTEHVWTLWDAVNALQWVLGHWWWPLIWTVIMVAFWFWGRESR